MGKLSLAVHRTIVAVDIEGFGDRARTNRNQVAVRDGLYRAMREAFSQARLPWADSGHEDRGDGMFVLIGPEVPKSLFVESLPSALVSALRRHNSRHPDSERIRLRIALHAGEVNLDEHGATSASINLTFRLLEAAAVKDALARSPGVLAVITSSWFFEEVVRHSTADAATYQPVPVAVKETATTGWICLPDHVGWPAPGVVPSLLAAGGSDAAPSARPGGRPQPGLQADSRRDAVLAEPEPAEQDRRWRLRLQHEHQRVEEMRGQFVPRIAGFTGRRRVLEDVVRWLGTPADLRPMIVTGDPGSGKTAVLGLLAALADQKRRPTVPRDGLPAAIPAKDAIGTAIYAGNLTTGQVLAGLATAAGIDDIDPDPAAVSAGVARLLSGLRRSSRIQVAMIDALDEAAEPSLLAEELIRPLIEHGAGPFRLLLGTRRHVCDYLGRDWRDRCQVIDLDSRYYADPAALAEFTRRILTRSMPPAAGTVFASSPPAVLDAVTAAISAAAGNSFFVARILAATQASQQTVPNPADFTWRAGLPRTAGPAMRRDLEIRLGDQAAKAVDLLRPLAYVQGTGLPWEDVWALLANALAPGSGYTNEDLLWLAGHAGSFIVEGGVVSDRPVYRLYHRSLGEDLIADRDHAADEHAIVTALTGHVPRLAARRDWPSGHPYIRTHLATHAARSGDIDDLAQDPGFLLAASPPQFLAALDATISAPARAASDAYRSALPLIRRHAPGEQTAYLGLAARTGQADILADRAEADGPVSPWRARWASWRPQRPHQQLSGHSGWVRAAAAAELHGRQVIITGSTDRTVRLWDLATGAAIGKPFTGHTGHVLAVTAAELDGRPVVISGSDDLTVRVWDLATGDAISKPFTGHTGHVLAVTAAELNGRPVVISGSDDRTMRVWDLATGIEADVFIVGNPHPHPGYTNAVRAVAAGELDNRPVAISGSNDGMVRVWDLTTSTAVGSPITGHTGPVNALTTSKLDGRPVIISASDDKTIQVRDLATGTPITQPLTGHGGQVVTLAAADLGNRPIVISGGIDRTVKVWDLAAGTAVGIPLSGHTGYVLAVAAAELDGRPVAVSGSSDCTVFVWDLAISTAEDPFTGHSDWVRSVAAATLGGRPVVISGSDDQTIRVRDLATGAAISGPLTGHTGPVLAVAAAELDRRPVVISGSSDRTLRVWDLATGSPVGEPFTGHTGHVLAVAAAELDGRAVVISGSSDRTLRVWDLATGTPVGGPFTGHAGYVNAVAAAELDGRPVVISGSSDRTLRLWDAATGTPVGEPFTGHGDCVLSVTAATLDGGQVAISGSSDCTLRVWDLATGTAVGEPFKGHAGPVNGVTAAELDGRPVVISGSDDLMIRKWDLVTGIGIGEPITGHTGCVLAVAEAELGGRPVIISGSEDCTALAWDLADGNAVGQPFTGHAGPVNAVAVAVTEPEGRPVIISGSDDQTVRVWDLATGTAIGEPFTGHAGPVNAVAAAKLNGRPVIISGSDDQTVRVWDLATGTAIGEPITGHTGYVLAVAATELNGRPVIISGSDDWTVRVWDLAAGTAIGDSLRGHGDWVRSVATADLGGRPVVISGSDDQTVRVWDLAAGTAIGEPLTGHTGRVLQVTATELDGRPVVISGSDDQTVRAWDLATATEIEDLHASQPGAVQSIALPAAHASAHVRSPVPAATGTGNVVVVSSITALDHGSWQWKPLSTPELGSKVLALAWATTGALVIGAELGIVVLEFTIPPRNFHRK